MMDSYLITENNLELVAAPIRHMNIANLRTSEILERIDFFVLFEMLIVIENKISSIC